MPLSAEPRVPWLPWSADAFARAAREGKPIVLSIVASWCEACREMDDTTWADDAIAAAVARGYVAIRVDSDRRPDINERYNLGGWPTTAFLDAEGALLGGGTFVGVDRMPGVLARVLDALARGVPPIRRDERRSPGAVETALQDVALAERVMAAFDEDYGGFGLQPKFPHAAPVRLAMALFAETGGRRFRTIAERTLDAIASTAGSSATRRRATGNSRVTKSCSRRMPRCSGCSRKPTPPGTAISRATPRSARSNTFKRASPTPTAVFTAARTPRPITSEPSIARRCRCPE